MILNSKTFFNIQLDIFRMFRDKDAIEPEDIKPLADFSKSLHWAVFGGGVDTVMPVDIDSIDFALRRIDVFKQMRPKDKRQKNLLQDFGMAVQKRLFN